MYQETQDLNSRQYQNQASSERNDGLTHPWEFPEGRISPKVETPKESATPVGFEVGRRTYSEKEDSPAPVQEFCIPAPESYYSPFVSIYDTAMEIAGETLAANYESKKDIQHKSWLDDPKMDAFLLIAHLYKDASKIATDPLSDDSSRNMSVEHDTWLADSKMLWMLDTGYFSIKKGQKYDERKTFSKHNDVAEKSTSSPPAPANLPPPGFLAMNRTYPGPSSSSIQDTELKFKGSPATATSMNQNDNVFTKHDSTKSYNQVGGFQAQQQFRFRSPRHEGLQPQVYRDFRSQQHSDFPPQNRGFRSQFHRRARPQLRDDFNHIQRDFRPQNYRDFRQQQGSFNAQNSGNYSLSDFPQQKGMPFVPRLN